MSKTMSKLAIFGGEPSRKQSGPPMFPGGMFVGEEEELAVIDVIRSKRLFRYYGPDPARESVVSKFETAFANQFNVPYAQSVNSGTSALITSLVAAGIKEGDEVIIPAFAWIATASAIVHVGAIPVVAEVNDSLTLDPESAAAHITPKTAAIIPVHMRGNATDMAPILSLAKSHGLKVIEDTAQACGGRYQGQYLGTFGDVGAFSLQFNKIITTGEGGMVLTKDRTMFERARTWHDGARIWQSSTQSSNVVFPGENYRMNELSGAVGLAQLGKLETIVGKMRKNKAAMAEQTAHLGLHRRSLPDAAGDASVSFVFYAPTAELAQKTAQALNEENIPAGVLYREGHVDLHIAAYWGPILAAAGVTCSPEQFPKSLDLLGRAVHLDVNPLYSDEDIAGISEGIEKVVRAFF